MTKGKRLQAFWDEFTDAEKAEIDNRYSELRARYLTLQELRKAHNLTQESLAAKLNIKQENVSRIEKRSDLLLSTLRGYVEAMGGQLQLVVQFPDSPPITLEGFSTLDTETAQES
ncbi:MAG: XRE family transcriptional regulator [Cyanobacteria bacterium J06635_1]